MSHDIWRALNVGSEVTEVIKKNVIVTQNMLEGETCFPAFLNAKHIHGD